MSKGIARNRGVVYPSGAVLAKIAAVTRHNFPPSLNYRDERMAIPSSAALADYDFLKDLPWLSSEVFGNSLYAYVLTISSFLAIWAFLHVIRRVGYVKLEHAAEGHAGDAIAFCRDLMRQIKPYLFPLIALHIATKRLALPSSLERALAYVVLAAVVIQIVRLVSELLAFLFLRTRAFGRNDDPMAQNTSKNIVVLLRFLCWTIGVLFLLDNAGFNVSTFLAGLGIGGVAIALATQAILGDAFSSFAIALDKPFEVGDFIIVDGLQGTVEYIGLKTTRVRSLGGEMLIFANSDLTKSRILNFKRMYQRRVAIPLSIAYDTPLETMKTVPALLEKAVDSVPETVFDRAFFIAHAPSGLQYELVYHVQKPDMLTHLQAQQAIQYRIHELLREAKINMSAPAAPGLLLQR